MLVYNIIDLVLLILFIIIVVILSKRKILKNEYLVNFFKDDILHTKDADSLPGVNTIYATKKGLSRYIKKYVFSNNGYDKLLILNYAKPFQNINYYVVCLNKKNKVIEVLETIENDTTTTSKIIGLNRNTEYVNIILKSVDGIAINSQIIKPLRTKDINTYSFLISLALFSGLYVLRDLFLMLFFMPYRYGFMNSFFILISTGTFIGLSIISYILTKISLRKRNIIIRSGGILEYEFF